MALLLKGSTALYAGVALRGLTPMMGPAFVRFRSTAQDVMRRMQDRTVGADHLDEEERKVHSAFIDAALCGAEDQSRRVVNSDMLERLTGLKLSHTNDSASVTDTIDRVIASSHEDYMVKVAFRECVRHDMEHSVMAPQ